MNRQEFYALIDKYLAGNASQEEMDLLGRYYNSFQQDQDWNQAELGPASMMETEIFRRIQQEIKPRDTGKTTGTVEAYPGAPLAKTTPLNNERKVFTHVRIAAAACIIGLLVSTGWIWFRGDSKNDVVKTQPGKQLATAAGGSKAVLQLADGSTIILDDAKNGALAQQGNARVTRLNGKLSYNALSQTNKVVYNTISTPPGGSYEIVLADGSHVWLNAASSLHFPAAFVGKERKVDITGEAYFEVAKNKSMPFIVSVNGAEVQVLGTHFNVMAYPDEPSVKTTLLEGAVKFVHASITSVLKPGQQSQLLKSGQVKIAAGIDVEEVVAWKNGLFNFQGADIATVSRQLARWYEVEVVYDSKIDDLFYAKMPRSTKLSDVLNLLELTGKVHFEMNGSRVIVRP